MHRYSRLLALYTITFLSAGRLTGSIIYVQSGSAGRNTGESWADAYTNLQSALERSVQGDEVWIAAGEYLPTPGLDRFATFRLKAGVSLLGGFSGSESEKESRNPMRNLTILSGNIGDSDSSVDNVFHVVECVGLPVSPVLDGLIIREGYNEREEAEGRGAGVYNVASAMMMTDCIVEDNFALGGAGIWNEESAPLLTRCVLRCNSNNGFTNWSGGNPTFIECEFSENFSEGIGAGFNGYNYWHSSTFVRCTFWMNLSEGRGAAYYGFGDPLFSECLFVENKTKSSGGVAYLREGTASFLNCTFFLNRAGFNVGGVYTHSGDSTPTLANCLFWENRAKHTDNKEGEQLYLHAGSIDYTCVQGWTGRYGGIGNFGDDPMFVDADKVNLHLRDDSPCFDAGDDSVVTQSTDLDGNPRILGARVDIGCYESVCPAIVALDLKCTNSGKLKATATTTLPEGATLRFTQPDAQGRPKAHPAAVNPRGKAVAKWRPDSDAPACVEGCSHICAQQTCP